MWAECYFKQITLLNPFPVFLTINIALVTADIICLYVIKLIFYDGLSSFIWLKQWSATRFAILRQIFGLLATPFPWHFWKVCESVWKAFLLHISETSANIFTKLPIKIIARQYDRWSLCPITSNWFYYEYICKHYMLSIMWIMCLPLFLTNNS